MRNRFVAGIGAASAFVFAFGAGIGACPADPASPATAISILLEDRSVTDLHPMLTGGRVLIALGPVATALAVDPLAPEKPSQNPAQELFRKLRANLVYDASARSASVGAGRLYPTAEVRSATSTIASASFVVTILTWPTPATSGPPNHSLRTLRVVPPRVVGGIVFIPLRAFAEVAGAYVAWNPAQRAVVLRKLPPSAQELAAEAEARERLKALGAKARQNLENAARNLSDYRNSTTGVDGDRTSTARTFAARGPSDARIGMTSRSFSARPSSSPKRTRTPPASVASS